MVSLSLVEKLTPKKQQTTYHIISENPKTKLTKGIAIASSNIIEESFANATSSDLFAGFEEELVTEDVKSSTFMHQDIKGNIEVISNAQIAPPTSSVKRHDEFDIFGNFVAEVMRNMTKPKSRILQMNIMKLIADAESDS